MKFVYVSEPVACFGGEIHSWEATPPLWTLTSVTAPAAVKTTPPLQSDQLFCLFTTIFWFLDYYGFKLDSITAWGTSVFKLIIHLIPSVRDFLLLWECLQSDSVHFCACCSHSHASGSVTSCSITLCILYLFRLPISLQVFLVLFSSSQTSHYFSPLWALISEVVLIESSF